MNIFIEKAKAALDPSFLQTFAGSQGQAGDNPIGTLFSKVVGIMLFVAGALAVIYFIYSGILYITAAGNPDGVKKGQTGLIYGSIGIVVIVLSYVAVRAIAGYAADQFK